MLDETDARPVFSRSAVILRTFAGAMLIAGPLAAGILGRSPLIVALFGVGFTVSKAITGRPLWHRMVRERGASILAPMVTATFVVQTILVTVLFLLGRIVGYSIGYLRLADRLERFDGTLVALVLILGVGSAELGLRESR